MRGDGKVEDCEMELVMITRGEEALTRTGSSSLISRWWESTLTAKVVSRPVPETLQVTEPSLGNFTCVGQLETGAENSCIANEQIQRRAAFFHLDRVSWNCD